MRKSARSRCEDCGGPLRSGRVTVDLRRGETLVVVRNAPADACSRCGRRYFHADVVSQLDRLVASRSKAKRRLKVPVLKFVTVA